MQPTHFENITRRICWHMSVNSIGAVLIHSQLSIKWKLAQKRKVQRLYRCRHQVLPTLRTPFQHQVQVVHPWTVMEATVINLEVIKISMALHNDHRHKQTRHPHMEVLLLAAIYLIFVSKEFCFVIQKCLFVWSWFLCTS